MTSPTFDFLSPRGYQLSGRVEQPETTPRGWAILAHCFTCGKESLAAARLARALALTGIGVLRFDFAGLGKSGGEFAETFAADVGDLIAAGEAMTAHGMEPSLLVGHSLGGAAALAAAGRMPSIRAVTTIGSPADVAHILHLFDAASLEKINTEGEAEVVLADRPFVVRKSFIDDVRDHDLGAAIADLHRPLLVLHAPRDNVVGIENASRIFLAAKHPKSFVSLDDADHLLTRARDADYVAQVVAGWSSRYVGTAAEAMPADDGAVRAVETGAGKFQVEITAGSTRFYADEPVDVGGLDSGPTPYQLVSAGLAACTAMTLRLYSARKQLPLERASVAVRHAKQPGTTPADLFTREVTLEGPLDDAQRAKLLEIADKCPVHRSLEGGASVETALVAAPSLMVAATPDDEHYRDMDAACREEG